jgi:hypothetical protein
MLCLNLQLMQIKKSERTMYFGVLKSIAYFTVDYLSVNSYGH